jgi:hypothetical protein
MHVGNGYRWSLFLALWVMAGAHANPTMAPSSPALRNSSSSIAKPAALKPALVVANATAVIQKNCQNPKPALIANVTLRNDGGGALAAGQGTVYVSEDNGSPDRLVSSGVHLPAFAPGESKTIAIPVISLSPYLKLAGNHSLTVHLLPMLSKGQYNFPKPAVDYKFPAFFPMGFCQGK